VPDTPAEITAHRRVRRGVRTRVLWLAALAVVPLLIPTFFRAFERRTAEERLVSSRAGELARVIARSLDARVNDANTVLVGLRELVDPSAPAEANDAVLQRVFRDVPLAYANLWIVDSTGRNIGAAVQQMPNRRLLDMGDREEFQQTLRTKTFTVGKVQTARGRADPPLVIPFTLPIVDSLTGRVRAVVGASALVDSLDAVQLTRRLPSGSVLTLVDRHETVVYRTLENMRWAGRSLKQITGRQVTAVYDTGGATADSRRSADGVVRVIGYAPMQTTRWMVYVGIPNVVALRAANTTFRRDLATSTIIGLLLLGLIGALSVRAVRPIESLTADALALTAGDASRRSAIVRDDELGELARAFNTMADAAEQRQRALVDSESRYRMLFDATPLPLFSWSPTTGDVTGVNEAAVAHFGLPRDRLLRHSMTALVHPDDVDRFDRTLRSVPDGPTHRGVWRLLHADGRALDMELVLAPYRREHETQIITVAIDTTARRAAERALEESREQLRQSQKMEALGSFAGGIAHDFNNYLSAIIGYGELVASQLAEDDPSRRDVSEVLGAASRAADLTRQILVFSRRQVVDAQVLETNEVVRSIERMLLRVMREDISFVSSLGEEQFPVRIDRGQLEQVLLNLAANARDAMPSGGSFALSTSRVDLVRPDPAHVGVAAGRYVVIRASDSGVGMPAAVRERIFEPFFTTKERGRGTGLGLAMVYSIVTQSGGAIRVDSAPGAGTTFSVYLPLVESMASVARTTQTLAPLPTGSERILLVEDDDAVRAVTHQMLARHGYDVELARDGLDALARVRASAVPFALVVTDVIMPGMRGRELAAQLRLIDPSQRVLFVSGYADDQTLVADVATTGAHFLAKPFTTSELLRMVREVLDRSPTVAAV
jgi:two-component system, cell cycle sensor histidine kinase and response regulator CckA